MAVRIQDIKKNITEQIRIIDIAKEFQIDLEPINSGSFNFRCRCPNKEHKNGAEKTPSLYIDSIGNTFRCFGCNASFNCLDFYCICSDITFSECLSILGKRIKNNKIIIYNQESLEDNLSLVLDISHLLRNTMLEHPKDLYWINQLMQQVDSYLDNIKKNEIKKTEVLLSKIKKIISNRYKK